MPMERMPIVGKPKRNDRIKTPDKRKGKVTMPVIRPGLPYQKDKSVNKLYKTY
jgi:hypothetical protein